MAYKRSALMEERLAGNRQRILLAARRLVAAGGFRGAPVTAVAAEAGVSTGLIYRHFPLREIHPNAQAAAELAEAAGTRGKFWEMHERLFARQDDLDPFHLSAYATELGIADEESDWQVEAGHRYADRVEEDLQGGLRNGVGGTPTIYVNGWRHRGAHDEATLQRAIELAG